jgi:hypothetical protein
MALYLSYLLGGLLLAILGVLVFGVVGMGRGGGRRSNLLMRWRIGLQFAALAVILLMFLLQQV